MSAAVRVVCRPGPAPGFSLLGLVPEAVSSAAAVESTLEEALRRPEPSVLLLEETLYDGLPPDLRGRIDRSAHPVVIPFPGPLWIEAAPAEERVVDLLRRAIGYRVKL